MKNPYLRRRGLRHITVSLRIVFYSMLFCCIVYSSVILAAGQAFVPEKANGWLIRDIRGGIVGSANIAQAFTRPEYLWPRPSAAGYNAAGAGGSNLSPAGDRLRKRVLDAIGVFGAEAEAIPADLVTASGSGLDPHITRSAATYQVSRIAAARRIPEDSVRRVLDIYAFDAMGFLKEPLVNVFLVNIELDRIWKNGETGDSGKGE